MESSLKKAHGRVDKIKNENANDDCDQYTTDDEQPMQPLIHGFQGLIFRIQQLLTLLQQGIVVVGHKSNDAWIDFTFRRGRR